VKGGFKHIDILFDGHENTPSMLVQPDEVDDELVAALEGLSWIDSEVGDVCWDDDIKYYFEVFNSGATLFHSIDRRSHIPKASPTLRIVVVLPPHAQTKCFWILHVNKRLHHERIVRRG